MTIFSLFFTYIDYEISWSLFLLLKSTQKISWLYFIYFLLLHSAHAFIKNYLVKCNCIQFILYLFLLQGFIEDFFLWFRHIPNNLSNYNVLTANAPFFHQISGTWSNHGGSILSLSRIQFIWIPSLLPGKKTIENFFFFVSNFVKNSILSLPCYKQKSACFLL
ncbi:hypothetical protein KPL70_014321 [Citrus sinensis]|nr:hypothetical protein KPL70_014321 [Citrus sinensis]